jgi:hypothetical protein
MTWHKGMTQKMRVKGGEEKEEGGKGANKLEIKGWKT